MMITDTDFKIAMLKGELSKTDYKAIKFAEGLISESDYAPIKAEREKLRAEIRKLEGNTEDDDIEIY